MSLPRLARVLPALGIASISILMACSSSDDSPSVDESAAALSDPGAEPELTEPVPDTASCAPKIDRFRELEIVHPAVIGSTRASNASDGPWSFRFLVEQMTPEGTTTSDFVLGLLRSWETNQTVNGVTVTARPNIDNVVINPWLSASGGTTLDMAKAPFTLQAIVYRPDLTSADCTSAGEGRFVFGVTDQFGNPQLFTMIFEYHLPVTDTVTPHTWSERFHRLHNLDIVHPDQVDDAGTFSASFNAELESITRLFNTRGAMPSGPNGNAISQVRSNEIALSGPWQLREFHLVADRTGAGFLVPGTTAQSPTQTGLNDTAILHDFISDNAARINNGTIVMNPKYTDTIGGVKSTVSILGPHSDEDGSPWMSTDPTTTRNPKKIDATTLTNFNFLTCNGCHNLENVQIGGFYQVDPTITASGTDRTAGSNKLSPFLLGSGSIPSDLTRRAKVMSGLICQTQCPKTPLVTGPEAARVE